MAKLKDIKSKHPEYNINLIDLFAENDPSKTNKYVQLMVNSTKEWIPKFIESLRESSFKDMFKIVNDFDELSQRNLLENSDIYSYKNNGEIVEAIDSAKQKITLTDVKKNQTVVLYEDDVLLVVKPLTQKSAIIYGKSTKWCTSSTKDDYSRYFKQYTENGRLIYMIDKTKSEADLRKSENIKAKFAFHINGNDGKITGWDVEDNEIQISEVMTMLVNMKPEIAKIIANELHHGQYNWSEGIDRGYNV